MKPAYIPALHHYGHQGLAEFHARQKERMRDAELHQVAVRAREWKAQIDIKTRETDAWYVASLKG